MEEIKKYASLILTLVALASIFINQWAKDAEYTIEISNLKKEVQLLKEWNTSGNTEMKKDIEQNRLDIDKLDEVKETVQVVETIRHNLDELVEWRNDWQVRVLPLDTEQDARIKRLEELLK